ncbi:MAG: AraC family transcriptional regulator ligand-binding domain-containing protein [Hyphomicrobium sp.]|jgi:AraC-like DNA-binding protein
MRQLALTRASTLGPILEYIEKGGGSVERVFQAAELPLQICDRPNALFPLRDQFKILELAARELGDDALPARLATSIGTAGLGVFGDKFVAARTLGDAITEGNEIYFSTLQSATNIKLTIEGRMARWSYAVEEHTDAGRQKNELLAMGYMMDLIRRYAGPQWVPTRVEVPGSPLHGRRAVENILRCDISSGKVASTIFPAELLEITNPSPKLSSILLDTEVPAPTDFQACLQELVRLGLLTGRPQRAWVARRLGLSVRTMQRRLNDEGISFAGLAAAVIKRQAADLLRHRDVPISDIAYELGYSDPAHFTRAFNRWYGQSPQAWRKTERTASLGNRL